MELMKHMHKIEDFFGQMKKANVDYGKMVGIDYAEIFWQHLGGGFQKESQIQDDIREYIVRME